jgi:putative pyrroloquinoline-quinone binding quinoprotein
MREDFVTRLQLQLRDAAERDARAGAFGRSLRGSRRRLGSPAVAGALAAVLAAIAVVAGAVLLRDEPEPAGPHVVARLELTGNPEELISAFGSLWIADPVAGDVVRVDPESRRVLARIAVGPAQSLALEPVGSELWVIGAQPTEALRIDPGTDATTGRVRFRTPAGRPFPAIRVFGPPAGVWAVGSEGALRIDPATGAGLALVSRPTDASELTGTAIGPRHMWALRSDGRIQRFDAATGAPQGVFRPALPGTFSIAALGDDLLALGDGTIARLDGARGTVLWERALGEHVNRFDVADGLVWVHTTTAGAPDRLTAVTADSGRTVSSLPLGTFGATGLAVSGREIWIDTASRTIVVRR